MNRRIRGLRWVLALALGSAALMLMLAAQDAPQEAEIEEDWSEQVIQGQELYTEYCAECHGIGEPGERRTAPQIIREGHRLADRGNAQRLYNYVSRTMPLDKPGELEEGQYWAVLAFVLEVSDLLPEGLELGPQNAEEVDLSP